MIFKLKANNDIDKDAVAQTCSPFSNLTNPIAMDLVQIILPPFQKVLLNSTNLEHKVRTLYTMVLLRLTQSQPHTATCYVPQLPTLG